jgi:DNA repair photolyase
MISKQILLSFVGDPYCKAEQEYKVTREALKILMKESCSVAILSKGGNRCLDDLDLFVGWPQNRIKVGATLTSVSDEIKNKYEPGAASPAERIDALKSLHEAGVMTWVSMEPVICPEQSLLAMQESLPFVDAYKVGKWNHTAEANKIDWKEFAFEAVELLREARKRFYVKDDLRHFLPDGYLTKHEADMNSLNLPERPSNEGG